MRPSLPRLSIAAATALAALLAGACERIATDLDVPDIDGFWDLVETLSGSGASCASSGFLNVEQDGSAFAGSAFRRLQCSTPSGPLSQDFSGRIIGGRIQGGSVSFDFADCGYTGTLSGAPPNRMSGRAPCTLRAGAQTLSVQSDWTATR